MKDIDGIWADEPGIMVVISEDEKGRKVIKIGRQEQEFKVLAQATLSTFRNKRIVDAFKEK